MMRRYPPIFTLFLFGFLPLSAQKPVALQTLLLFRNSSPEVQQLFTPSKEAKEDIDTYVSDARSCALIRQSLDNLLTSAPGLLRLSMPEPMDIQLDLFRVNIYADMARIRTSSGESFSPNPHHLFYRGMIHGNPNSMATVSVFEDHVLILFADEYGNHRIQRGPDGAYIILQDKDIRFPPTLTCHTDESGFIGGSTPHDVTDHRTVAGNCVEVYLECDYKSYQDNGSSVANTEEWVGELWNEVITLYANEDIPVSVSDIFIYTSSDPFTAFNATDSILYAFVAHIDTLNYDGRLAHLLSTRGLGGGIAYIDVLCSNLLQCAFSSGLSTNIVPVPTYSWSVEVVTHEMGHNMGSPHTHACAWNGNNTAIDGCGPAAGYFEGCNGPLPASGTIMSYCHLVSGVGINFANGFGEQPGDLIRDRYNNAACNTGTCTPPPCTSLSDPLPNATNIDINTDLYWASSAGAMGYKLRVGTSPTNGSIVNNIDVGNVTFYDLPGTLPFNTTIYVKITPYNELGESTGCANQTFVTETNSAPQCTQVTQPANGATSVNVDAVIYWAHSVGNQTGYKISIGTTLNGTDIANQVDVGNVNHYDHPVSFPYATTLYVKITPYWAGGNINGCTSQSFTTWVPIDGDFCSTAIQLDCNTSLSGSTILALPDNGLPFCGTSIDAPGVWYKFTGDGQNAVLFTCTQFSFDTKLNAYKGSCGNLTCVTGIDDFCAQGSQITFPTTNGTNYYILVQGWNGAQGTFTISRSCYSGPIYCQSSGFNATLEWIKKVVIDSFIKNSTASSYSDFTGDVIHLSRGATYSIELTPMFAQASRWEYYKIWADLNHDGDFTDSGENLFSTGPSNTAVNGTITIPVTATSGTTRLRVTMSSQNITSSCGTFGFGEVEDYTLNIHCNIVTSTADAGNGSLRNVSQCVDDGEAVLFSPGLNGQTINVTAGPITATGNWKWMAEPESNITIKAGPGVPRVLSIPAGMSAEIQNLKLIGGTENMGSAVENMGSFILRDSWLCPATGTTTIPLRNAGTTRFCGNAQVRNQ